MVMCVGGEQLGPVDRRPHHNKFIPVLMPSVPSYRGYVGEYVENMYNFILVLSCVI